MIRAVLIPLAVTLFTGTGETDAEAEAAFAREADAGAETSAAVALEAEKTMTVTSRRSDFDRQDRVALFEDGVCVQYGKDYTLMSDRLFVFLGGSNELSRIVADGRVAIVNEDRSGTCASAVFRRKTREIEMLGDGKTQARLVDATANAVEGRRIRFWLDSEQVEVENSGIEANSVKGGKSL